MLDIKPLYNVDYIDDNGHFYFVEGKKYGSVTSVLGIVGGAKTAALMGWSVKTSCNYIAEELKKQLGKNIIIDENFINELVATGKKKPEYEKTVAGEFGTMAHELIDNWIKTKEVPAIDHPARPVFDGFMKFIKENNFNIVSGDLVVGSRTIGLGGRADIITKDEMGNYSIIDIKTSAFTSPEFFLQTAAYAAMFAEQYGVALPQKCYIIKFAKDKPIYEIIEVDNIEKNWHAFLAAKELKEVIEGISKNNL